MQHTSVADHDRIAQLESTIRQQNECLTSAATVITQMQSRIDALETVKVHDSDHTISNPALTARLLPELIRLAACPPSHRRYSTELLQFAFLIKSLSPKAYRQLRTLFPLPCKETLRQHFSQTIRQSIIETLRADQVAGKLETYRIDHGVDRELTCTLAVDAASVQLFHLLHIEGVQQLQSSEQARVLKKLAKYYQKTFEAAPVEVDSAEYRHFFAYVLLPLEHEFPPLLMHVSPSVDGHFRDEERSRIVALRAAAAEVGFNIKYLATDADTGTNTEHTRQSEIWASGGPSVEALAEMIPDDEPWWVSDVFHILKNARSRLVNHKIAVDPRNGFHVFDAADIQRRLRLGKVLDDDSPQGKMNDSYPMKLFTTANALKEMESGHYFSGFYLMCYSLLLQCFCNDQFSVQDRLTAIDVTFWLFYLIRTSVLGGKACGIVEKWSEGNRAVTFADNQMLTRILNTLLALRAALREYPDGLSTKRLSSHECENLFGLYRSTNWGCSTWATVQWFVGHLAAQYHIRAVLGLGSTSLGRRDYAGVVSSAEAVGVGMRTPCDISSADFAAGVYKMFMDSQMGLMTRSRFQELLPLLTFWLSHYANFGKEFDPEEQQSPLKGTAIHARNIKF